MNDHLNPRSAGIDLLRCLSVLLVIFSHYGAINGFPLGGTHGVVIFFMVSGYCMFYSMKGRGGAEFIAARFWRLIPMLVICATITHSFEIFFYAIPDRSQSFKEYLGNVACLPAGNVACDIIYNFLNGRAINYKWVDGVYWSLLVEIRFYMILWILYYFMKIKSPIILISVLGFLSLLNLEWNRISKLNDFFYVYAIFFIWNGFEPVLSEKKIWTCVDD